MTIRGPWSSAARHLNESAAPIQYETLLQWQLSRQRQMRLMVNFNHWQNIVLGVRLQTASKTLMWLRVSTTVSRLVKRTCQAWDVPPVRQPSGLCRVRTGTRPRPWRKKWPRPLFFSKHATRASTPDELLRAASCELQGTNGPTRLAGQGRPTQASRNASVGLDKTFVLVPAGGLPVGPGSLPD